MIEEKIQLKRKELNESIEKQNKYEEVYRLSIELDDLISEFYKESQGKRKQRKDIVNKGMKKILYIA